MQSTTSMQHTSSVQHTSSTGSTPRFGAGFSQFLEIECLWVLMSVSLSVTQSVILPFYICRYIDYDGGVFFELIVHQIWTILVKLCSLWSALQSGASSILAVVSKFLLIQMFAYPWLLPFLVYAMVDTLVSVRANLNKMFIICLNIILVNMMEMRLGKLLTTVQKSYYIYFKQ